MRITFPHDFIFRNKYRTAQIETAWSWLERCKARDGESFDRTTDHEQRFKEDAEIIASLVLPIAWVWCGAGSSVHLADFDAETVREYHEFLRDLRRRNVSIMMVLHHFTNQPGFQNRGWEKKRTSHYGSTLQKVVDEFGEYVSLEYI